jgi:hypothetical protein
VELRCCGRLTDRETDHRPDSRVATPSDSTLSEQVQPGESVLNTGDAIRKLLRISVELLTESQRSGILQVRTADLNILSKAFTLTSRTS